MTSDYLIGDNKATTTKNNDAVIFHDEETSRIPLFHLLSSYPVILRRKLIPGSNKLPERYPFLLMMEASQLYNWWQWR
jgi:hypothetical protein